METLNTVESVVRALGPRLTDVARRYHLGSIQVVNNWCMRGRIPPRFYLRMVQDLTSLGASADPRLWGVDSTNEQAVYHKSPSLRKGNISDTEAESV